MQLTTILLAIGALGSATTALGAVLPRNTKADPLVIMFFENGCLADPGQGEAVYEWYSDDETVSGTCVAVGWYNWQTAHIQQDSAQSYVVELFSGEGCNNPVLVTTESGCFTQPEGTMILSARATYK